MQLWEYLEVHFGGQCKDEERGSWFTMTDVWADSLGRSGVLRREPRMEVMVANGSTERKVFVSLRGYAQLLNSLGDEGWELVTTMWQSSTGGEIGMLLTLLWRLPECDPTLASSRRFGPG